MAFDVLALPWVEEMQESQAIVDALSLFRIEILIDAE
jgi:hypothetical protein